MADAGKEDTKLEDEVEGGASGADSMTTTEESQSTTEWLTNLLKRSMKIDSGAEAAAPEIPEQVLEEVSVEGVVKYMKSGKCKNIITMAGAGISTSAGIPDFRSPGTGLYDNLQKYHLPSPQAIFDIDFFKTNPEPFFHLAKELWPGIFKPTPCHYFLRLVEEKGLLLRHFTQNIDTLERVAGIRGERVVEAHGTFHTAHCVMDQCRTCYSQDWIKEKIFAETIPTCEKEGCGGLVKPDIVFFGEPLPANFFVAAKEDLPKCDLLIVMGTSLVVQPFASLACRVEKTTPRMYINLEKSSGGDDPLMALMGLGHSFQFDADDNYRDVFFESTCDEGCLSLAEKLGWGDELKTMIEREHLKIDKEIADRKKELDQLREKGAAEKAKCLSTGAEASDNTSSKEKPD